MDSSDIGIDFGDSSLWPADDLVAISSEIYPSMTLDAYRQGLFPMPIDHWTKTEAIGWFSPCQRGILPCDSFPRRRSLRKMARRYITTVDIDFEQVIDRCADPSREGHWIDGRIRAVYGDLHDQSIAHSIEVWDEKNRLVGGLYGVLIGSFFAGESMFHDPVYGRDASKVALWRLVDELSSTSEKPLLDIQWTTDHLVSLGAVAIPRPRYLEMLGDALCSRSTPWNFERRIMSSDPQITQNNQEESKFSTGLSTCGENYSSVITQM